MNVIIGALLIGTSLLIIFYINQQKKKGKLQKNTYSYRKFLNYYLYGILIIAIISFGIYLISSSGETALTLGIFALFCLTAGLLNNLFAQHKIKRRGG